jgi:hypothetical protein
MAVVAFVLLFSEHACNQLTLVRSQPFVFCRMISQNLQHDQSQNTSRYPFNYEHPLPTREAQETMHLQQPDGQRPAH